MRFRRTAACLVASLAVGTVGCANEAGSDSSPSTSGDGATAQEQGDSRSDADRQADEAVADATLLTLDDFPAGWEEVPATDDEDDDDLQTEIAECLDVDPAELTAANPSASSTFASPDDEEVSAKVSLTPSSEDTSRALEIMRYDAAPGCYGQGVKALLAERLVAADDVPEGLEIGEPTFNRLSFEDLGDDSVAFRLTIPVSLQSFNVDVYIDLVVVRVGRAGITTTFQSELSPFDPDEAARLTQIVVDRVAAAAVGPGRP